jgi:hypothetical protein
MIELAIRTICKEALHLNDISKEKIQEIIANSIINKPRDKELKDT